MKRTAPIVQGLYFLITGLWPLIHIGSFLAVTGPKRDLWLVRTVAVLISLIGGILTLGGVRRSRPLPELALLGVGSALGLGAVETNYAARGRISPIYLLDAMVEAGLVALWLFPRRRNRRVPGLPLHGVGEEI